MTVRTFAGGSHSHQLPASVSLTPGDDIQAALNLGAARLGPGVYPITTGLTMPSNASLVGSGKGTILRADPALTGSVIRLAAPNVEFVTLADFRIDGNKAAVNGIEFDQTGTGFAFSFSDPQHVIRDVLVVNCGGDGVRLLSREVKMRGVNVYKNGGHGFVIQGSDNKIDGCVAGHSGIDGFSIGPNAGFNHLLNCKAFGNGRDGFRTISTFGTYIGCHSQDNAVAGFTIAWSDNVLTGCIADSNGTPSAPGVGFDLTAGSRTILTGCYGEDSAYNTRKQGYGFRVIAGVTKVSMAGAAYNNLLGPILNGGGTDVDVTGVKAW